MKEKSTNGRQTREHRKNLVPILLFYVFAIGLLILSAYYIFYIFTLEIPLSISLYMLFSIPTIFIIYRSMSGLPTYYHGWKKMDFQHYFILLFAIYLSFLVLVELEMNATNYGIYVYLASLFGMLIYIFIFLFFSDGLIKIKNHVYFYQTDIDNLKKLKEILDKKNLDYVIEEKDSRIFIRPDKIKLFIPSKKLRINFSPKGITLISSSIKEDTKNLMKLI